MQCKLKSKYERGKKRVISDDIEKIFPINSLKSLSNEGLGYSVICKNKLPTHFLS